MRLPDLMALDTTGGEFVKRGASGSGITRNGGDAGTTTAFATIGVAAAAIAGVVAKPVPGGGPSGATATCVGFALPGLAVTTGTCVATGVGFALPGSAVDGHLRRDGCRHVGREPSATLAANCGSDFLLPSEVARRRLRRINFALQRQRIRAPRVGGQNSLHEPTCFVVSACGKLSAGSPEHLPHGLLETGVRFDVIGLVEQHGLEQV